MTLVKGQSVILDFYDTESGDMLMSYTSKGDPIPDVAEQVIIDGSAFIVQCRRFDYGDLMLTVNFYVTESVDQP